MTWLVATFGCWCCTKLGIENRPDDVLIHHTDGKTKPLAHYKTIPLCDGHHSPYSAAGLHHNKAAWEREWGKQVDILEEIFEVKGENPVMDAQQWA